MLPDFRGWHQPSFTPLYGKREAYLVSSEGGEATKICDDCGTWNISHDATNLLYWYSTGETCRFRSACFICRPGRKVELIRHPSYSLYQPQFSPDDRFVAFLAQRGQGRSQVYRGSVQGSAAD